MRTSRLWGLALAVAGGSLLLGGCGGGDREAGLRPVAPANQVKPDSAVADPDVVNPTVADPTSANASTPNAESSTPDAESSNDPTPLVAPPQPGDLQWEYLPSAREPKSSKGSKGVVRPAARDPSESAAPVEAIAPVESIAPPEVASHDVRPPEAAPEDVPPSGSVPDEAPSAPDPSDYTVVQVFYGTDRAAVTRSDAAGPGAIAWVTVTLLSTGAAMILLAVALRFWRTRLARGLAAAAVVSTVCLGLVAVVRSVGDAPPVGQTTPSELTYGYQRGALQLGTCEVSIPKSHEVGELESPSIVRFEFREDPSRHVVLLNVESLPSAKFYDAVKACVAGSRRKAAFVFVHGYNVSFESAARRTAQMSYDLKFDGAPIFYSWPSQGGLLDYTIDENNVVWTVPHLRQFLTDVAERSGATEVHLIAHSMGNRALTSALRDLSFEPEAARPKFHQVVLTAPDIDAEVFKHDVAPRIVKTAQRVTLYASSNDKALASSKQIHAYPRAGDSGQQLLVLPDIDTIDVSAVDTSLLGHSYYGSNDTVLADLFDLLHDAKPPDQRRWLRPERLGDMTYWSFWRR
ncbi:MAG: alpha/beta hydrolase [Pirellulales bacterium]|nr:alpha/beta hydrolase [Pirellulales bacterium]